MKIAYLDCPSGISGDMMLGALVDAGLSIDELRGELAKLPVEGYRLEAEKTQCAGLAATKVTVVLDDVQASANPAGTPHRTLPDILSIIEDSALPPEDKERSALVFCNLAEAEATVHGVEPEAVEFHEVGAVDAIVDIAGAVAGLRLLGIEALYCSPLPAGSGWTNGEHGRLPVPAPATLALLSAAGAPVTASVGPDDEMELVTPTGAALVATLAAFQRPAMTVRSIGYGAGSRELEDRPNALRLWLGDALDDRPATMLLIETNIDDMSPELIGYAQERLFDAGAADVWLTPVQMKKNRPGVLLSVICSAEREDAIVEIILRETSTLGVRVRPVTRHEAEREELQFDSSLGPAAVKVKRLSGRLSSVAPEYEACARIARERGLPLQEVYRIVEREAQERLGTP